MSPRTSGLLLHVTSLPGPYGIGDLGPGAARFVDYLARAGQRLWQVLPLVPTDGGNSPYASPSTFAGNALLLSPERLVADGLLTRADLDGAPDLPEGPVDFDRVRPFKDGLVRQAFERFAASEGPLRAAFDAYAARHAAWLDDYALFAALQEALDAPWTEWPRPLRRRDPAALDAARRAHAGAVERHCFAQFLFDRQWAALRGYARARGVRLLGDLPIYVSADSADVWANPAYFFLDDDGRPTHVAGVPPDYFSETGQRWGNPLYRWDRLADDGFRWWTRRLARTLEWVDLVRLDHFRAFEAYWEIPADEETAVNGRWVEGPGDALFEAFAERFGTPLPLVAEDLGMITPEVRALMRRHGLPGMAVLQFAFGGDADGEYLPHRYRPAQVAYTGTHDNNTTAGWWADDASEEERAFARRYLALDHTDEPVHWAAIRAVMASVADTAVVPLQDVAGLGSEARMNTPGDGDTPNWAWRATEAHLTDASAVRLRALAETYGRTPSPTPIPSPPRLGALPEPEGTRFRVWAPNARRVELLRETDGQPVSMDAVEGGYHEAFVPGLGAGARYRYRLDGGDPMPDPASRFQPEGVHGPSEVVDPAFDWTDAEWTPPPLEQFVIYELHVGTFTPEGTFRGVEEKLPYLRDLGVTAVELMPVADFPGRWNWGYDTAALYAPSRAYGTPDDLRRLVDRAHALGLAVLLDVVYNHLGPDGAYLPAYGPVFTDKHETPWGQAINLDDDDSRGVRDLILDNARHWLEEYHLDGLRLDATHALVDDSETHLLTELSAMVEKLDSLPRARSGGPRRVLIAEDHRNLNRLVLSREAGGYGLDGVWVDDLHHQVRNLTAGDEESYYADYAGSTSAEIAATLARGWYYDGRPSRRTGEPRGTSAEGVRREQCVVCIQNHDQVGNRPVGNRLTDDVSLEVYRAASALLLVAPETPLLFMGQEWATKTPFQFFTDHNAELGPLVSAGRKKEFEDFPGFSGEVPDPQDPATFARSTLDWDEHAADGHAHTLALYRALLKFRSDLPDGVEAEAVGEGALVVRRGPYTVLIDFDGGAALPLPDGAEVVLHTEEAAYAPDPQPPAVGGGAVRFARAGALVARS